MNLFAYILIFNQCFKMHILPLSKIKRHAISSGSGMPSFRDKANFYKIHPSLPAKNKILNLMKFFVKCFSTSLTACSKKVFFASNLLRNASEMGPRQFLFSRGYEMTFYKKNLRFCSLFYMFRAFRIHFDINFSVKDKLTKCISPLIRFWIRN